MVASPFHRADGARVRRTPVSNVERPAWRWALWGAELGAVSACLRLCGGALVTLTTVVAALAWSAPAAEATFPGSNGRIAYTWLRGPDGDEGFSGPGFVGVVSVRPDGTGRRLIARKGLYPGYSPDGRRIAFIRARRLWVARADGEGAHPVTPKGLLVEDYEWSPRGDRLAVTREFTTVSAGWLTGQAGRRRPQAARHLARRHPALSGRLVSKRQGNRLRAAAQSRPGIVQIARGGRIIRHGVGIAPTWSRRGLIAYEPRNLEGIYRVCATRPLRASKPVRCFGGRGRSANSRWSPDGGRLMFDIRPTARLAQSSGRPEWTARS